MLLGDAVLIFVFRLKVILFNNLQTLQKTVRREHTETQTWFPVLYVRKTLSVQLELLLVLLVKLEVLRMRTGRSVVSTNNKKTVRFMGKCGSFILVIMHWESNAYHMSLLQFIRREMVKHIVSLNKVCSIIVHKTCNTVKQVESTSYRDNISGECKAGTFRKLEMGSCMKCGKNTISTAGATSCTACAAGTVANKERTKCGE